MFQFPLLSCNQDLKSSLMSRLAPPLLSTGICHNASTTLATPEDFSTAPDIQSSNLIRPPSDHQAHELGDASIVVRDFALHPRVVSSTYQAQSPRQRAHSSPSDSLLQGFLVQEVVASSAVDGMSPSKSDFQFTQKDVFGSASQLFLDLTSFCSASFISSVFCEELAG